MYIFKFISSHGLPRGTTYSTKYKLYSVHGCTLTSTDDLFHFFLFIFFLNRWPYTAKYEQCSKRKSQCSFLPYLFTYYQFKFEPAACNSFVGAFTFPFQVRMIVHSDSTRFPNSKKKKLKMSESTDRLHFAIIVLRIVYLAELGRGGCHPYISYTL